MRNSIKLTLIAALQASSLSFAAGSFSVKDWSADLDKAIAKNDRKAVTQLLDFNKVEAQALPNCDDCNEKKNLADARRLFGQQKYADALQAYSKISKDSDNWLFSVEEKGWTYFRQDKYDEALAQTKTLLSPTFEGIVDTESYFLQALSQLRICDYKGVFLTNRLFKKAQRQRIIDIQDLADKGTNQALVNWVAKTDSFPVKFKDVAENTKSLPLLVFRDLDVQRNLLKMKLASYAKSKGFNSAQKTYDQASMKFKARVKALAQSETEDNFKLIQKLNLLEVEAIQRVHTDQELNKKITSKGQFQEVGKDQLVFLDDGNPWIDELDKYQVSAQSCRSVRRKM
jgi:hypothetical protein